VTPRGDSAASSWSENGKSSQATAVLYLRVSTKEQAEKNGEAEGYSIPAQRIACQRKAESLGATVIGEFVDRGESARSARRPELQRMLACVKESPVTYAIVHKVDRLARDRFDDVQITLALRKAGVTPVSCSENIDETPSGILLHGIMSAMAEFYSRNLANEVMKGLVQKAECGGTPGKAPLGYRNVRGEENGRDVRTVEIDPARAPLVTWAFEAYATGEWTQRKLLAELTRQGLDIPACGSRPAKALSLSYIQYLLTNPYYKGIVRYRGVEYQGRHEPLVTPETWELVQEVLRVKNEVKQKERVHPHYLKGIYCGSCGSRMIVTHARSRSGRIYPYFVCIGRHQKRNDCQMKAVLIDTVERLVEEHYATVQIPPELGEIIEHRLKADLEAHFKEARVRQARLEKRRTRLLAEREKLLQAHYAGAVPLDLLRQEQARITSSLARIDEYAIATENKRALVEINLKRALELASDCQAAYESAPDHIRKLFNQAFFKKIFVVDETHIRSELTTPFDVLLGDGITNAASEAARETGGIDWAQLEESWNANDPEDDDLFGVAGLKEQQLVGPAGFEPATVGL
jgi:site-specific DNA recombinase